MGYDSIVLPCGDWKIQFDHNDIETRVTIIDDAGVCKYLTLSRDQAQKLKRHLVHTLPYEHGLDD